MKKTVRHMTVNMALWATLAATAGLGISACSSHEEGGEHEEVMAVDMVDEAAELARKNAPAAEDMGFEETSATAVADNAMAADEAGATESDAMSAEQEMTGDAAEPSAAESTAMPESAAEATTATATTATATSTDTPADAAAAEAMPAADASTAQ